MKAVRIMVVTACAAASLGACRDAAVTSTGRAAGHANTLASLADGQISGLEAALPEAAAQLAARFAGPDDPRLDVVALHDALVHARASTPGLDAGPSSFFAVLDAKGVVLRNNLVTDEMAGTDFFAVYPQLAKGLAAPVETLSPAGSDEQWLAAVPIGAYGELVTGFTYRAFAARLSDALRAALEAESRDAGRPDDLPVFYVAVFDPRGVFCAPHTPATNDAALRAMDLVTKTAQGSYVGTTTIAKRAFGVGATRAPKLGAETGIVVLRSEI